MRHLICIVALYLTLAAPCHAGAWTQDSGKLLLITTADYYSTSSYFDNAKGDKRSQPAYHKFELNPYAEYGLTEGTTIGANLSMLRISQASIIGGRNSNFGLGDSEWFIRQRLWQRDGFALSAEPMIKLPSPSHASFPRLGSTYPDAGLGLSGGYGFSAYGQNHFADIDTQYRYRFGLPKDQIRLSASFGIGLSQEWTLLPQAFLTYRTGHKAASPLTLSDADDYNLAKLQLSALYAVDSLTSLQAGAFTNAYGRNTGAGGGGLIALWRRF